MKRSLGTLIFLVAAFYLLALPSAQQSGQVLYVNNQDPTCNGRVPCFTTIQAAIDAAQARDQIQVQAGTYPEQLSIEKNNFRGVTESDRIVIEADPSLPPNSVRVTGSPGPQCTDKIAIRFKRSKFITIRGLTITGTGAQAMSLMGGNNGNEGIHIERNRIFANGSSSCNGGITIARDNPDTLIVNNLIYANGRNGIAFIDADGGPHYIVNNTIYGNQWNGIDVSRGHEVFIVNNIVDQNGTLSGSTGGRYGVQRENSTSPQPQGVHVLNNLICGNRLGEINGPILDKSDAGNFTPSGNEGFGVNPFSGCEVPGKVFGDLNGPDELAGTLDDDFSLKPASIAIDLGMDARTLKLDPAFDPIFIGDYLADNVSRPHDGNGDGTAEFDVGAFEFAGDIITPQVVIVSPHADAYVAGTITVSALATDNVAVTTITLSAEGQNFPISISPPLPALSATASGLWNTTALGDGNAMISAKVVDSSANTVSATRSVIVDNTPPDTQITVGPTGEVSQTTASFSFTGTDNLTPAGSLLFAWRMDGGAFSPLGTETSVTVSGLGEGAHTFEVKARDLAGNEDPVPAARAFTVRLGPVITKVDPASGVLGTLVTISGSGFEPGATHVGFNGVAANIRTMTATSITTTVPPTATTGLLTVTTPRGSASRQFTVTRSQDFTLVTEPSGLQVVQESSTAASIATISSGGFSGLIQLATGPLPTGVNANFVSPTLAPDNSTLLTLRATNAAPVGVHLVEIRATALVDGQTVTHTGTVTLNIASPGQTVLAGQILDADERPLAGASIKLGGPAITPLGTTDAAGNFFIPLSATGPQVFLIDGSTVNTATINYPTVPVTLDIQPAVVNELGYIPRLRGQPAAKLVPIVPGQAVVITDPDLPGFKMTIPEGVRIIGWDGQPNTQFSVTPVPVDRSPLPPLVLPAGLEARETYLFSFGKVGGGVPTGNIPIDLPNNSGGLPGEKADLYYFNEAPDGSAPNRWEKYGTATVSDDGATLVTDINPATGLPYGIPRFCCGALTPVFNFINRLFGWSGGPSDGGKRAGDPVDVSTGFFYVDKTDMILPGRLPVVISRTYRTNMSNSGPFGIGTRALFDISLQAPSNFNNQTIVLISPGNKQDILSRQADGRYINTTSPALRGAVLTINGPTEPVYSLRFKDGMVWGFNTLGLLFSQSDRNGNTITYFRDNFSRVVSIQEPAGRSLSITYVGLPGQGIPNIQTISDPSGRQVRYTYDEFDRLETVTDPAGGVTRYSYDSADRMLTITDPRGITFLTNEYDANGRVVRQIQGDGGVWTFAYTSSGTYINETVATNPRGHATSYRFNAAGYQISETNALGLAATLERQAGTNLVLSVTDPLKRVTRFEYDSAGNVTKITDPTGNARSFSYNSTFNKVTTLTDPLGKITRFEYDPIGNLTAAIDPLGNRTTIAYNSFGQPTATADPLGNVTTFTYDSIGNLATIADPLGNNSQRAYDAVSRLVAQTDPRGKKMKFAYDALNRLTGITDAAGGVMQFNYDGNGNLLTVTDARGSVTGYEYDSMDRMTTRTDPVGAIESYQYDGMGNLSQHIDRKGQLATFSYDALERRTGGGYADGTSTSFVYDAVGRLIQASDSAGGTIGHQYDTLDRLVAQISGLGSVSYEYDAIGRRTRMDTPGQSPVTYNYDAASRLRQVVQGTQVVGLTYDASGRRTFLNLPNNVSAEYQYDTASRLTALIYRNALGVLGDLTYQYDRAGNRTGVGGSFARTLLPSSVSSATYDTGNRQLEFGNKQMTFDENGNLSAISDSVGTTVFKWDARNRLSTMTGPLISAGFVYDVLGRRSEARSNNQTVRYQYDGLNPIQETSDAGISANNLTGFGIDEYFMRTDFPSGARSYLLADVLGSTVALSDDFANTQTEYTYEPFGKTAVTLGENTNPFQFSGRESDATGLHYYRARYYNSETHRFIGEDPIGFAAGDANLFAYAKNSPTNFRDPTGQFVPAAVVAGGLCAAGAVAGTYAYQQLSGRKTTIGGMLGSAAAGCLGGLGLGWGIGIALEAAVPSLMVGGGEVVLWGGMGVAGPQLATAKAVEIGTATIYQTFTGSTLSLLDAAGVGALTTSFWPAFSANFVSGAGSATVLLGRGLASASVLLTKELPVLLQNQAVLNYVFHP